MSSPPIFARGMVAESVSGRRISIDIGDRLGGGATGTVYRDRKRLDYAIKLIHHPKARAEQKIRAMLAAAPPLQTEKESDGSEVVQIAWPQELILDASGKFCGFSMRLMDKKRTVPLNAWFDPRSRARNSLTQSDLVKVYLAANLASVTEYINDAGHAVVDFKPENVWAYRQHGYVCLTDCDGFLIRSGSDAFPASATNSYLAPEYHHGFDPAQLDEKQDRFALAVVLYMLLDNGRHPAGGSSQHLPDDQAGRLRQGAIFLDPSSGLTPPANSHHQFFPDETLSLFRKAFIGPPPLRPTSQQWKEHLRGLTRTMTQCPHDPHHWHYGKGCPWCVNSSSRAASRVQIAAPSTAPSPLSKQTVPPIATRLPSPVTFRPTSPAYVLWFKHAFRPDIRHYYISALALISAGFITLFIQNYIPSSLPLPFGLVLAWRCNIPNLALRVALPFVSFGAWPLAYMSHDAVSGDPFLLASSLMGSMTFFLILSIFKKKLPTIIDLLFFISSSFLGTIIPALTGFFWLNLFVIWQLAVGLSCIRYCNNTTRTSYLSNLSSVIATTIFLCLSLLWTIQTSTLLYKLYSYHIRAQEQARVEEQSRKLREAAEEERRRAEEQARKEAEQAELKRRSDEANIKLGQSLERWAQRIRRQQEREQQERDREVSIFVKQLNARLSELGPLAFTVDLVNKCTVKDIHVAVSFKTPDNSDRWATLGWWKISPGASAAPSIVTENAIMYFWSDEAKLKSKFLSEESTEVHPIESTVMKGRFLHYRGTDSASHTSLEKRTVLMEGKRFARPGKHSVEFECK